MEFLQGAGDSSRTPRRTPWGLLYVPQLVPAEGTIGLTSIQGTVAHSLMRLPACETPGWQFIAEMETRSLILGSRPSCPHDFNTFPFYLSLFKDWTEPSTKLWPPQMPSIYYVRKIYTSDVKHVKHTTNRNSYSEECLDIRGRVSLYEGVSRYTWACLGIRGRVSVYVGVSRYTRACLAIRGRV